MEAFIKRSIILIIIFCLVSTAAFSQRTPLQRLPVSERNLTPATLWKDGTLSVTAGYYGRAKYTDSKEKQIFVNTGVLAAEYDSGYAWDFVGFYIAGSVYEGGGKGQSETLKYNIYTNKDKGYSAMTGAAMKAKLNLMDGITLKIKGGYLPINSGMIGSDGEFMQDSYRGIDARVSIIDAIHITYTWVDQFKNSWDDGFRNTTNKWHQDRWSYDDARRISYVHSAGLRFLMDDGVLDFALGEALKYRRGAQVLMFAPVKLSETSRLELVAYAMWAKNVKKLSGFESPEDEYHYSGSIGYISKYSELKVAYGYTIAHDSNEMNFRLTPKGNSDSRSFSRVEAQLDDFVWHKEMVFKGTIGHDIGHYIGAEGIKITVSGNYGWNINNPGKSKLGRAWEVDYSISYKPRQGMLKGLEAGVYCGHLRAKNMEYYKVDDKDDTKVMVKYTLKI